MKSIFDFLDAANRADAHEKAFEFDQALSSWAEAEVLARDVLAGHALGEVLGQVERGLTRVRDALTDDLHIRQAIGREFGWAQGADVEKIRRVAWGAFHRGARRALGKD